MADREPTAGFLGIAALMGLCCGLPVLASAGVLGAIAGLSIGSWALIVGGCMVAMAGVLHLRSRLRMCEPPSSIDTAADGSVAADGRVHQPSSE